MDSKDKIKGLLKKKGFTQKSLADKMGISATSFHNFLSKNPIPEHFLDSVFLELGISREDFDKFGGSAQSEEKTDSALLAAKDEIIATQKKYIQTLEIRVAELEERLNN